MPPRVLIAATARQEARLQAYLAALRWAGAEPHRAWPAPADLADPARLRAYLARFDGLILPGGGDVEPWRFGEEPHPALGSVDAEIDAGQLALARLALESARPTLAICRGIQVLGVAAGCPLYQDLPSQRPSPVRHRVPEPTAALAHEVEVEPGSRLAALAGATRFPVNSRHHQAVRESGEVGSVGPLRVVARAPDGVVEGVELPGPSFVVGVQWHPENLVEVRPEAAGLLRGFVAACEG